MKESKAEMFNRKASKSKYKADLILKTLSLKSGQIIADLGSGGGYFTYRFADAVGKKGQVFAVDNNQEFLDFIKNESNKKGLENVDTIPLVSEFPELPKKSLDYIFMRNVCHHLQNRVSYFKSLKESLKSNGKIAIIEYDGRGMFSFHKIFGHFVPQQTLVDEMKEAGYKIDESYDFLSEQSFTIFSIK